MTINKSSIFWKEVLIMNNFSRLVTIFEIVAFCAFIFTGCGGGSPIHTAQNPETPQSPDEPDDIEYNVILSVQTTENKSEGAVAQASIHIYNQHNTYDFITNNNGQVQTQIKKGLYSVNIFCDGYSPLITEKLNVQQNNQTYVFFISSTPTPTPSQSPEPNPIPTLEPTPEPSQSLSPTPEPTQSPDSEYLFSDTDKLLSITTELHNNQANIVPTTAKFDPYVKIDSNGEYYLDSSYQDNIETTSLEIKMIQDIINSRNELNNSGTSTRSFLELNFWIKNVFCHSDWSGGYIYFPDDVIDELEEIIYSDVSDTIQSIMRDFVEWVADNIHSGVDYLVVMSTISWGAAIGYYGVIAGLVVTIISMYGLAFAELLVYQNHGYGTVLGWSSISTLVTSIPIWWVIPATAELQTEIMSNSGTGNSPNTHPDYLKSKIVYPTENTAPSNTHIPETYSPPPAAVVGEAANFAPGENSIYAWKFKEAYDNCNPGVDAKATSATFWRTNMVMQEFVGGNHGRFIIIHDESYSPNSQAYVMLASEWDHWCKLNYAFGELGRLISGREIISIAGMEGINHRFISGIIVTYFYEGTFRTHHVSEEIYNYWKVNQEKLVFPYSDPMILQINGEDGKIQKFIKGVVIHSEYGTYFMRYDYFKFWEENKTLLGFPKSEEEILDLNGQRAHNMRFKNGIIVSWTKGMYSIQAQMYTFFSSNKTTMGLPLSNEEIVTSCGKQGINQYFEKGVGFKYNGISFLPNSYFKLWEALKNTIGFPISPLEIISLGIHSGDNIRFENGIMIRWEKGVFSILGDFYNYWLTHKEEYNMPYSNQYNIGNNKTAQDFMYGTILKENGSITKWQKP